MPLQALEHLGEDAHGLDLTVETSEGRIDVRCGESLLAFRPCDQGAMLESLRLAEDRGGAFFHRIVSDLMSRFSGDLHVKLTWAGPPRPSAQGLAEVRIERGATRYPSLKMRNVVDLLRTSANPPLERAAESSEATPPAPEASDEEIEKLLERGRQEFAEYQRLRKG